MKRASDMLVAVVEEERGAQLLEWGLVCGLIIMVAITAITVIGPSFTGLYDASTEIPSVE